MSELTVEDLHDAMRARRVANMRYQAILAQAKDEGWNNSQIARAVGLSEAAIRLYWRRHPNVHTQELVG